MEILAIMIICSITLAGVFLILFIYAVKKGQFEDSDSAAVRMLNDSTVEEDLVKK